MANAIVGNKIYVDSTGSITTDRIKVAYIIFTPSNANDSLTLRETSSGNDIIFLQGATAKTTLQFRFEDVPILFNNGLYVQQISSGAKVTLVTTSTGA